MAAASPPLLPTTVVPAAAPSPSPTPTPIPTSLSSADATETNPAALRAFLTRLVDTTRHTLSGARPWSELTDRSALSRPDTLSEATSRLRKNLAYFRVNYAAVTALCLAAALLAHPFSLAALLALLAAWCLLYVLRPADAPPVAAFGRTFSDREVLGGLVAASAFVVFLTSVGSLIFSALALGAAVVCAHGACRVPEDLFLDEVGEQGAGGAGNPLLSFIASATGGGRQRGIRYQELAKDRTSPFFPSRSLWPERGGGGVRRGSTSLAESPGRSPATPCLPLRSHDWFTNLHLYGLLGRSGTERRHLLPRCASSGVLGPKGGTFRRDVVREEVQNNICREP